MDHDSVEWRKVPSFENYSVSSNGDVRNDKTGYLLHPVHRLDGRMQVYLSNGRNQQIFYVHTLVYDIFNDGNEYFYVVHKDGDLTNNSIDNLLGVQKPNGGKGKARPRQRRRIRNITTGDIYESIVKCVLAIGGTKQGVWNCLNGHTKTYKGFIFEYID